jgi:hypothetical protein
MARPFIHHEILAVSVFSSESFSLLMRRLRGQELASLLSHLIEEGGPEECQGLSLCFYQTLRLVNNQFHSRGSSILSLILDATLSKPMEWIDDMLDKMFVLLGTHKHTQTPWEQFFIFHSLYLHGYIYITPRPNTILIL